MKREYKVYKKDGYIYVHYDGFPEGVKIEKIKDFYNYPWGWMTIDKVHGSFNINDEDHRLLFNLLWNGTIVVCNELYGVVDSQGDEVMPCVFDQIEKLKDSIFGRKGNNYWELRESGRSVLRGDYSDTGFYVDKGKKGWQEDGKVVIPAQYDDIHHYENSNFYQVLNDEKWSYINRDSEPVLTYVRKIEGLENKIPFPFDTNKNDVLVLQEYVGECNEDDKNVVLLDGVWQKIDRISGNEICKLLVNPNDEKPLSDKDLELFNNKFSYEFASYQVTSKESSGIIDCLKKLQSMGLHSNTWNYIVKVWKAVDESPSAEELRFLRYQIEEHGQLGDLSFGLAHDTNLKSGETRMFVVTHYNERCWPAQWEYQWWDDRNELPLNQIKRKLVELRKTIYKHVLDPFKEEVWQDQLWGGIYSIEYNKNRTWKETLKVLEYFKGIGSPIIDGIRKECEEISATLHLKTQFSRAKCRFHFRKLRWLLENGADINAHYANYTGLDYLVGNYEYLWDDVFSAKDKVYIDKMRAKITNILLEHGAKTLQQVREEESTNDDYKIELKRMN